MSYEFITGNYYPSLYDEVIEQFKEGIFVEVGCFLGKSTAYLTQKIIDLRYDEIELHIIDSFTNTETKDMRKAIKRGNGSYYDEFIRNMKGCNVYDRIYDIYRNPFDVAVNFFAYRSCNFVFINNGFSYNETYGQMDVWYKRVRKYGVLAGANYTNDHPEIVKAVMDFSNDLKLNVIQKDKCWMIQK